MCCQGSPKWGNHSRSLNKWADPYKRDELCLAMFKMQWYLEIFDKLTIQNRQLGVIKHTRRNTVMYLVLKIENSRYNYISNFKNKTKKNKSVDPQINSENHTFHIISLVRDPGTRWQRLQKYKNLDLETFVPSNPVGSLIAPMFNDKYTRENFVKYRIHNIVTDVLLYLVTLFKQSNNKEPSNK